MNPRTAVVFSVLIAAGANTRAQNQKKCDLILYGVATRPCGEFLSAQEKGGTDYGLYVSWLQGYLSALNIHSVYRRQDVGKATDVASMLLWIKNHCAQNPLDNFMLSVLNMAYEIRSEGK